MNEYKATELREILRAIASVGIGIGIVSGCVEW